MKVDDIRNVGICGHGGSGKTTLAEAMLLNAGTINRMGTVEQGNTVSDFHRQEIERQISISTSMMHFQWMEHKINLVDTPGYLDFIGEVYGAMHVVDIGLVTVDASAGVEVGTELHWKYGKKHDLSKFIVFNKLDKEDISFDRVALEVMDQFGPNVIVAQFPVETGAGFTKIVDLIRDAVLVYQTDGSGAYTEEPIPDSIRDVYNDYRLAFMESIIEHDEALMEKYLDDQKISEEELKRALSHASKHNEIYPILCCSAKNNIGVSRIMEILVKYGASASDLPDITGKDVDGNIVSRACRAEEPLAIQIFKTISESHVGELSFVKVYSGVLKTGMDVHNANNNTSERISTLYMLNGKERHETNMLEPGDMGGIIKLKHAHTNDTLCDANSPVVLSQIKFPEPVIRAALVTESKGDEDKLSKGLAELHQEDPTFHFHYDGEIRQTIVSGQGELQLDWVIHRLQDRFGVNAELLEPRIPFRETIRKPATIHRRYKKQSGGRGQYGDVHIEVKPLHRGGGFQFVNNIVGGAIPSKYIPAVEKGVTQAMAEGYLTTCPIVDLSVRLFDGSYHSVDSSDMAFQIAGSLAMKEAMGQANPIILEPLYELEIRIPEEYMGAVMGDVSQRRGKVLGMDSEGNFQIIHAEIPLAELWKYSSNLRSISQGRGRHSRKFSHYEPVPKEIQTRLTDQFKSERESSN
ncbi:elongation factor G [Sulfidibacter corallicola]|uniref:Elongation factor G n=1 Tax=Sulfidibacter corallicola TaxID=2818388 RepID=A0A8A4TH14_SULCO|nr:elongation factor G [Sulfidibacter corallicola]QTD48091.1 elongation factor G [Sulfidibacter corallicola]